MPTAFLCHASEDKPVVEAVYERLVAADSDLALWLDKYEIVAGESLLDKIADGMDRSEKFVVFLSRVSIKKPWVQKELKRAIMREIRDGTDFIIPVLVEPLASVPPFLEEKKYVALHELSEVEWVAELSASIRGNRPGVPASSGFSNLKVTWTALPGEPHKIRVTFEAVAWAEQMKYAVRTSADLVAGRKAMNGMFTNISEVNEIRAFGVICDSPQIRPGQPFLLELEFAPGTDAARSIVAVVPINRS